MCMCAQCVVWQLQIASGRNFGIACQSEFTALSNYQIDDFRRSFDLCTPMCCRVILSVSNETWFDHEFWYVFVRLSARDTECIYFVSCYLSADIDSKNFGYLDSIPRLYAVSRMQKYRDSFIIGIILANNPPSLYYININILKEGKIVCVVNL